MSVLFKMPKIMFKNYFKTINLIVPDFIAIINNVFLTSQNIKRYKILGLL